MTGKHVVAEIVIRVALYRMNMVPLPGCCCARREESDPTFITLVCTPGHLTSTRAATPCDVSRNGGPLVGCNTQGSTQGKCRRLGAASCAGGLGLVIQRRTGIGHQPAEPGFMGSAAGLRSEESAHQTHPQSLRP